MRSSPTLDVSTRRDAAVASDRAFAVPLTPDGLCIDSVYPQLPSLGRARDTVCVDE
jgi:hypothetical protein